MSYDGYSIGVGITTYNRFDMFKKCFESVVANTRDIDEIVVVDDCSTKDRDKYDKYFDQISKFKHIKVRQLSKNRGVGAAKNIIMQYFTDKGYDFIFTIEDDIIIKSPDTFKAYIDKSVEAKIEYINFAEHGSHNKRSKIVKVNGVEMKIYPNIVGAFSLYTKKLIKEIGFHDEQFINAMEHVDYCYRASEKGLTTPFWKFCDLVNNTELIEEQENSINQSSITCREDWIPNLEKASRLWKEKYGRDLLGIPGRW